MRKVKNYEGSNIPKEEVHFFATKEILVLGGEGAGKTLLSRRLHECNLNFVCITPENTVPTTGSDLVELSINGRSVSCREVGSSMSSTWGKYLSTSSYILFVVDLSDPGGYPSAVIHLTELLTSLRETTLLGDMMMKVSPSASGPAGGGREEAAAAPPSVPTVLLIFNKADLADAATHALAMSMFRLREVIELYQSPERRIQTFLGSCMNLQLAKVLLKWIANNEAR